MEPSFGSVDYSLRLNYYLTNFPIAVVNESKFDQIQVPHTDNYVLTIAAKQNQLFYLPLVSVSEFGLIFIVDDIYASQSRSYIDTTSLCSDLKIKESFSVPEDRKWCVVMTLSDEEIPIPIDISGPNYGPTL